MKIEEYLEENGQYYVKKPIPIKVVKMPYDFTIKTLHGKASGKTGDYVARTPAGDLYPIDQKIFKDTYMRLTPVIRAKLEAGKWI